MSFLLDDLAEETAASNRRVATRLDEACRHLVIQSREDGRDFRQRIIESAEQSTDDVLARVHQAEAVWRRTLKALGTNPRRDDGEALLVGVLEVFASGLALCHAPKEMWKLAVALRAESNRLEELSSAQKQFEELMGEARKALEHRRKGWQPSDPERFALGVQMAKDTPTIKADAARARFRRATE